MLAWHLARTDRDTSTVLMGLTMPVIDVLALLQPQQIDRLAERYFAHIRPRWEDQPSVWRQLLSTQTSSPSTGRAFTLRVLQLSWCSLGAE